MRPLRVAVIGAGYMGRRHAEKVAALSGSGLVRLTGVADLDRGRAERVAAEFGGRAVTDARDVYGDADVAIVAVPTLAHRAAVCGALEAGVDVLVEKPVAANLAEGEQMLALARRRGRVLHVGHQEWFNAAMRVIRERIRSPRFVEAHRIGPFPDRATDVDVVRELMIHDLDILQQLLGEEPERIEAIGVPVLSQELDIANARLSFPGGCVANLTASRVSAAPMRKLRFFQRDGYFSIDFLAQSAAILRRLDGEPDGSPRIEMEEIKLDPEDALSAQLRAFLAAVHTRDGDTGFANEALGALRTALRVLEAIPSLEQLR